MLTIVNFNPNPRRHTKLFAYSGKVNELLTLPSVIYHLINRIFFALFLKPQIIIPPFYHIKLTNRARLSDGESSN